MERKSVMSYYGTQEFDRMIEAKGRLAYIPSYEIELAARRMRAEAVADLTRKAAKAVREFFATRPAPAIATGHTLTEQEKARLAQGEAIAGTVIAAQGKVRDFFAARQAPAPVAGYRLNEQDLARLAQAEAIAEAVLTVSRGIAKLFAPITAQVKAWRAQLRTREELEALDERTLADIGLTRSDIPRVAAGLWVPENRGPRPSYAAPAPASNLNKPQIAA
jgi:uncharacterized protein YjiS (DUF1127 family)